MLIQDTPAPPPAYVRTRPQGKTQVQLQTAIRRFVPKEGKGTDIWLVGVTHIGEADYYHQLQTFLDKQGVVLYERVKPPKNLPVSAAPPSPTNTEATTAPPADKPKPPVSVQKQMATTLGLSFQLDAIRYDRPHFVNSDLAWDEMQAIAAKSGENTQKQMQTLQQGLSGQGAMGGMLTGMLKNMEKNEKQRESFKTFLVQILGNERNMTMLNQQGGLSDVVIVERNKVVFADLQQALSKRPTSIAVFYGAAHMGDFEKRLAELGYRRTEERWLTAITAKASAPRSAP